MGKTELENILKQTLKTQSQAGFVKPKFEKPEDFGSLKEIKVTRRGVSGKAMFVDIITDKGTFTVSKELPIRRTFQKTISRFRQQTLFLILKLQSRTKTLKMSSQLQKSLPMAVDSAMEWE